MNRRLKSLGAVLFTLVTVTAVSASPAVAADFHSEVEHTEIKGSQVGTDVITFDSGTMKCSEIVYTGTQATKTATTVKVTPEFVGCTAFGYISIPIDSKQCTYEFSGDNSNMTIACPATEPLSITAFNCWVTIPSQTTAGGVTYANKGAGTNRDLHATFNISGIHYVQHSKAFPGCSNGTRTNGKYTGETTFKGFTTTGVEVGIWRA